MMRNVTLVVAGVALLAAVVLARPAYGCDVPVYRYALANWAPDLYQVIVFLDGEQQENAALEQLRERAGNKANFKLIEAIPSKEMDPFLAAVWDAQTAPKAPWVVVRNPMPLPPGVCVWAGAMESLDLAGLVESNARGTIAKQLQQGALGAWLLLACGDTEKDEQALNTLRAALEEADVATAETLGEKRVTNAPPMADCVLKIDRTDEAEAFLVESLLATEADLRGYDEPMVFPVYGRGRALYALIGGGINHDTIMETALFLAGDCSCEVKDDNPGVDLLFSADWGELGMIPTATGYQEIALPALD